MENPCDKRINVSDIELDTVAEQDDLNQMDQMYSRLDMDDGPKCDVEPTDEGTDKPAAELPEDDVWNTYNPLSEDNVLNSTRLHETSGMLDIQISPVKSMRSCLMALKKQAAQHTLPEPTDFQKSYGLGHKLGQIRFKLDNKMTEEKDQSSVGRFKEKCVLLSQREKEEVKKNILEHHLDKVESANCKLATLKKLLKSQMVEKRRKEYEKRVQLYQMENEEVAEEYCDEECSEDEPMAEEDEEAGHDEEPPEVDFNEEEQTADPEEDACEQQTLSDPMENVLTDDEEPEEVEQHEESLCYNDLTLNKFDSLPSTQNLILSPQTSVPMKNYIAAEYMANRHMRKIDELVNECKSPTTSQDILDLCSGKIKKSLALIDDSDEEDSTNGPNEHVVDTEQSDQKDAIVRKKDYNFDESDDEMDDFALKLNLRLKNKQNLIEDKDEEEEPSSISENDEQAYEEEEEEEDESEEARVSRERQSKVGGLSKKLRAREFIEDQAELSEEDAEAVSSDEDENEIDEYEEEAINEDLPSDQEILAQNNKMFWKQQMDEDKRELLEYQERFLEHGDLHKDQETRKRKFKWKNVESTWVQNVFDSESEEEDAEDAGEVKHFQLKHINELQQVDEQQESCNTNPTVPNTSITTNTSVINSSVANTSVASSSFFAKQINAIRREMVSGPSGDIKSYIIKDKNLVKAMSLKRPNDAHNRAASKRVRSDVKTSGKSIFDAFQF